MVKNIISALLLVAGVSLYAQENLKIDKKLFSEIEGNNKLNKVIKQGDSYYIRGLYDAALEQYMKLYAVNDSHSPLNYKIAVSNLYGVNPKQALAYFDRVFMDIASDFLCLKGIALMYHQRYDEAEEAFRRYEESLPPKEAQKVKDKIDRFVAISNFSANAVLDSLPVFIINAGPQVNSYYDDYGAVELLAPSPALYFTSRRPKDNNMNIESQALFSERILFSSEFVNGEASEAKDTRLTSGKHLSVAGADNNSSLLLYYKGKKRFGDIYSTQFNVKNGKTTKNKRLPNKISKKTSAEGSISFADNGDVFFISDRLGGVGGKDIWFAAKKGNRGYLRPRNLSEINTPVDEVSVFVTPDGNTLYFSSNGLPGFGGFDIYKSFRTDAGTWGAPVNMGYPVNSPDDDLFYRITSDTTLALFSSKRSGGFGGLDIYYAKTDLRIPFELSGNVTDEKTGNSLAATVRLFDRTTDMPVETTANDTTQQRYVLNMEDIGDYYVQAEAPGYRSATDTFPNPTVRHAKIQLDFELEKLLFPYTLSGYITDVRTGRPVFAEILIKPEGMDNVLYRTVTDERSGFYTITMADKENFDLTFRATDYFDHNESLALKNTEEEAGSKNITMQKSVTTYYVTGVVTGEDAAEPLIANISVSRAGDEPTAYGVLQFAQETATEENGKYELALPDTGPYLLEVTAEGHFFVNSVLLFTGDSTLVIRNFTLTKMESGAKMVVENILFNTGNATLRPESFNELNKLVNLLRENPNIKIEVSGHTDNTGSAALNKTLSRNRALSVRNYLISQGIAGERVAYEGYGFDRPIAPNNTEEGRAANRRVEIEILD